MAIIPVPSGVRFTDFEIWLDAPSDEMKSPFNGKRQVAKQPYDVWNFEGDLVPVDPMEAGPIKSFLMKLSGKVNAFKLPIAGSKYPTSAYSSLAPIVSNTSGQTGTSINFKQASNSTLVLKEGDYFNIGNELKVASADVVSNSGGFGTITFMPPLRDATVINVTPITVVDPFLYLHATRDDVARWNVKPPVRHAFKLQAEEEI